jgi:release factor glutamine methyltransferase
MMTEDDRPELAKQRDIETVYQPAEDSALLAGTVLAYVDEDDRVLDVGTGSGYVPDRIQTETGASVVGIDVNPEACKQAFEAGVPVVRGDLLTPFQAGSFDVICCNPPYLPTPPEDEWGDLMEDALSGGEDGRAVVDPFLADVGRVLTTDGQAFLLISTLTGPEEVHETATEAGLAVERVSEESQPFEKLLVFRLTLAE